jgi:prevent-host-death family protein
MTSLCARKDVEPLSAFRVNAAKLMGRVQTHKRPLVLTRRGQNVAVVLHVGAYGRLIEELELLRDVHFSNSEIAAGDSLTKVGTQSAAGKTQEVQLRWSLKRRAKDS